VTGLEPATTSSQN